MKKKPKKDKDWISRRLIERKEYKIDDRDIIEEEKQVVSNNEFEKKLKITFGKNLRETRLSRNMSQEELAAKAKLHRTYISDVERWKKNISLENIWRLAKALKIHIHNLMRFWEKNYY